MTIVDEEGTSTSGTEPIDLNDPSLYINRELSWVRFNEKVLEEAQDRSLPLLERGWYAVTKTVGPAPTLAPGVLGQTALLLLLATVCKNQPRGDRGAA